jgi:hypothetical protein
MAVLGLLCASITLLVFGWVERVDHEISGNELAAAERARFTKAGAE